jgi:hypothetical protein
LICLDRVAVKQTHRVLLTGSTDVEATAKLHQRSQTGRRKARTGQTRRAQRGQSLRAVERLRLLNLNDRRRRCASKPVPER